MEEEIEHGAEPARFPCIETEKALSRAQGLTKALFKDLPEIWQRELGQDILTNLDIAREAFREVLQSNREERMRLIELGTAPRVI
jgi:hypothetical protein